MNENQQKAIDSHMTTLTKVLQWGLFEVYLSGNGFLNDNECQVVNSSGPTNDHKIIRIFSLLRWKEGSWELLMKYLREHKYPWLATELSVAVTSIASKSESGSAQRLQQQQIASGESQVGSATSYSSTSVRNLDSVGCFETSGDKLQPSVSMLVKSASDISTSTDVSASLGLKDKILMFEEKLIMDRKGAPNVTVSREVELPEPHRSNIPIAAHVVPPKNENGTGTDFVTKDDIFEAAAVLQKYAELEDNIIAAIKTVSTQISFGQLAPHVIEQINVPRGTTKKMKLEMMRIIPPFLPQCLHELTVDLKANLVEAIMICILANLNDEVIVDCGADVLSKLEIFSDPIDNYTKTVQILLEIISSPEMKTKTKTSTIRLLDGIIVNSDETRQNLVGQLRAANYSTTGSFSARLHHPNLVLKTKDDIAEAVMLLECAELADTLITQVKELSTKISFGQLVPRVIKDLPTVPKKVKLEMMRIILPFAPQCLYELTADLKASLAETILNCILANLNDETIVDSGADVLAKLEIFSDPIDNYTKAVEILLMIISNQEMKTKTKTSIVRLFGGIVVQSDKKRKNVVGQVGAVEKICDVIRLQLDNSTYDQILESSWNCIYRLCSSLENNRKVLCATRGMELLQLCYGKFFDEVEMVAEMMGATWMLSWYAHTIPQLLSARNCEVLWKIFLKFNNNVAVSYKCVASFDNIISLVVGHSWPLDSPTIEEATNRFIETISSWKLDAQIYIAWSGFHPFLEALKEHRSPLSDLIRIWTFANLTTIDTPKYCPMLSKEGGVEILTTEVIRHSNSSSDAIRLASVVIENIKRWDNTAN